MKRVDPCLSRAPLLLSTNSTDDGSSIPTFTLVIPVGQTTVTKRHNKVRKTKTKNKEKRDTPTTLFSGGGGIMKPWSDCLTDSFS